MLYGLDDLIEVDVEGFSDLGVMISGDGIEMLIDNSCFKAAGESESPKLHEEALAEVGCTHAGRIESLDQGERFFESL